MLQILVITYFEQAVEENMVSAILLFVLLHIRRKRTVRIHPTNSQMWNENDSVINTKALQEIILAHLRKEQNEV